MPPVTKKTRRGDLAEYARKRDFAHTPEPSGATKPGARRAAGVFVVQRHAARRIHYDFRLELDGVLKSWAVPRGPSPDPGERRMAVETEDHPLDYADFEGVIPAGHYGAGAVRVWDRGTWEPIGDPRAGLADGRLEFHLFGAKLRGRWHLVRMRPRPSDRGKKSWLLIKGRDSEARDGDEPESIERASGALPRAVEPQLATLVDAPPSGAAWIHEIKLDGYRIWARIEGGRARLLTRSGKDWTSRLTNVAEALAALRVESALLDGEVVALDAGGRSDFQRLQNALEHSGPDLHFYAFDLLHLDGFDLRDAPLVARKEALRKLLAQRGLAKTIHYTEHVTGTGAAFFAEVCKSGGEGIVSKLANAPYRGTRTRAWLKVKCIRRQEFVVVGFTDPARSRVGLGALLLAVYDDAGALRYAGKVGTGFSDAMLASLRDRLAKLERGAPSVVDAERAERGAHWVEPALVAEVAFTEWTRDGKIRQPAFVALRSDKAPSAIRREIPLPVAAVASAADAPAHAHAASGPPPERAEVAGVRLSHPGRIYFPDLGVTKSELAQYYEAVAERALAGLAHRPLSLLRCPDGCDKPCFFQKHATDGIPKRVGRVVIDAGEAPYTMVRDLGDVVSLVQMGVIEFHVWGARADQIERPDLLVFDLDPDPSVPWRRVADTAKLLRVFLQELELVAFLRTTGGKGLHVVVPLLRRSTWADVKSFTRGVALRLVREAPDHFTAQLAKRKRTGKILIDTLRNQRDATAIASYSVRARPGAPVAMPIDWDEIETAPHAPQWNVRDAAARLAGADPWRDFEASRRVLGVKARERVQTGSGDPR